MYCPNPNCSDFISTGVPGEYEEGVIFCPYCGNELVKQKPNIKLSENRNEPELSEDQGVEFVFVGFWKRVLATLVDVAIGFVFMPFVMPLMVWCVGHRNILPQIVWTIVWTIVWLWLVVHFGGTPGKLAIRARIVDAQGQFLSWGRAILRIVPTIVINVTSLLEMGTAVSRYPDLTPHATFMEVSRLMNVYGRPYSVLVMLLGFFIYVDIGCVLFNQKKRAVHDFIAGSYVITEASYNDINKGLKDDTFV